MSFITSVALLLLQCLTLCTLPVSGGPPVLTSTTDHLGTLAHNHTTRSLQGKKCKKLLWFMALHLRHDWPGMRPDYVDYVEVAIMSAKQNAPSLIPILIYDGPPGSLTAWVERLGGKVIFHYLTFYEDLRKFEKKGVLQEGFAQSVRGTYLRMDIALFLPGLLKQYGNDVEQDYFLYTDNDVMFLKDMDSCSLEPPESISVGPEFNRDTMTNVGILYANTQVILEETESILAFAKKHKFKFEAADQTLLLTYFKGRITKMPDEFNWKGYWGDNPDAVLVHWHGPKPMRCLPCFLNHVEDYAEACPSVVCPEAYKHIFNTYVNDGGQYIKRLLQLFYRFRENVRRSKEGLQLVASTIGNN